MFEVNKYFDGQVKFIAFNPGKGLTTTINKAGSIGSGSIGSWLKGAKKLKGVKS